MSCIAFVNEREACLRFIAARRLLLKASFYSLSLVRAFGRRVFVTGINSLGVTRCVARGCKYVLCTPIRESVPFEVGKREKRKKKGGRQRRRLKSSVGQSSRHASSIFFSFFFFFYAFHQHARAFRNATRCLFELSRYVTRQEMFRKSTFVRVYLPA